MKIHAFIMFAVLLFAASRLRADDNELLGAGATFPLPLYTKMFDSYNKENGLKINYQGIGSGGGIKQISSKTIDFGGTDGFMSDEQLKAVEGNLLHIPVCLGAVAVTYNLPGNPELRFTPEILAQIFLGTITKWSDPAIQKENSSLTLPDSNIIVVHRSDGSGTSYIFTDYLSKISTDWAGKVGKGTSVNWPVGLGGKGNDGVAGLIRQVPGSIGYMELIYAFSNKMPAGIVKNKSGSYIKPSIDSTSAAANLSIPDDTRTSITDTIVANGYPISGFTWILVYQEQNYSGRTREKASKLSKLLWWMVHQGQSYTKALHYAPLPDAAVKKAEKIIKSITYAGSPLL